MALAAVAIIGIRHLPLAASRKRYIRLARRWKGVSSLFSCRTRVRSWHFATQEQHSVAFGLRTKPHEAAHLHHAARRRGGMAACGACNFLPHLLRNRVDASRAIGLPWPNPAASNESRASLRWLARPSSKLSKPTGSPSPMRFMHTSPANSIRPGRHSSATCPAQCPGVRMTSMPPAMGSIFPSVKGWSMATGSSRSSGW
jgi:hypothetical protein